MPTKSNRWLGIAALVFLAATAQDSNAQTLTTLLNFDGPNGDLPRYAPLLLARDGNFYGTTTAGGPPLLPNGFPGGWGTVFKITPAGSMTTLYRFAGPDGSEPTAGLIQTGDGNLWGTTTFGGAYGTTPSFAGSGYGTVFKITPDGSLVTVHSFSGSDGFIPSTGLLAARDGNLYGTTNSGGVNGKGTIFRVNPNDGAFALLYSFAGSDGLLPTAALIQGRDGNLYGTTVETSGVNAGGTIFKISLSGQLTVLHGFDGNADQADGFGPSSLIQASDGNFYGTAFWTVFRISPAGTFSTIYTFDLSTSGAAGTVIQSFDGNLYGTTTSSNSIMNGTLFRLSLSGQLTTLYTFSGEDGRNPTSSLTQGSDGNLYGTTEAGGTNNFGTIFRLALGPISVAAPSINTGGIVPVYSSSSAIQPGEWVSIYGTNLAGSTATWSGDFPTSLGGTSVQINGKAAYLSYVSPGQINLQAPDDTATGTVLVGVTTAGGGTTSTVTLAQVAPAFALLDSNHVAGIIPRSNGSGAYDGGTYDILGPTGNSIGYSTVAAKAGDSVELFGVGFGPTTPAVPAGQAFSGAAPTTNPVQITIGGMTVIPSFAGLSEAGLNQINVTIPAGLGPGDLPLVATVDGVQTQARVVISLQ